MFLITSTNFAEMKVIFFSFFRWEVGGGGGGEVGPFIHFRDISAKYYLTFPCKQGLYIVRRYANSQQGNMLIRQDIILEYS